MTQPGMPGWIGQVCAYLRHDAQLAANGHLTMFVARSDSSAPHVSIRRLSR